MPRYTSLLRHFAIVVNASTSNGDRNAPMQRSGSVSVFVDGERVGSKNVSVLAICGAANSAFHSMIVNERTGQTVSEKSRKEAKERATHPKETFILGAQDESNPPGSSVSRQSPMELQQFRLYPKALNEREIQDIHTNAVDTDGTPLRKCSLLEDPSEVDDLSWKDALGHNCAWYATHRTLASFLCSGIDVRTNCKVACSQQQCFRPYEAQKILVTQQVQMFTAASTLCVSSETSDDQGLPLMSDAMFSNKICNATSAKLHAQDDVGMGSRALRTSSAAIGMRDPVQGSSAPTQTSWLISPEVGGNVTLLFTSMDFDLRKERVTVRRRFVATPFQSC